MGKDRYKSLEEFKNSLLEIGLKALDNVYVAYKDEFLLFSKKFTISEEDAVDIYQDTIIAFYENVKNGKLTELTSSLKTYIFSIGKYGIYNKQKKGNKTIVLDRKHLENLDLEAIEIDFSSDDKSLLISKAMAKLGDRCKQILMLFYYHAYSIEALKYEFDYKNENVVRSHKSRCLKNLKEIIKGL